jgi:hypothetical protein
MDCSFGDISPPTTHLVSLQRRIVPCKLDVSSPFHSVLSYMIVIVLVHGEDAKLPAGNSRVSLELRQETMT